MMTELRDKRITHVGVRFYRLGSLDVMLVPLVDEAASFARSAGDGYFLVVLLGEPGTAYPLDLRSPGSFDPEYLASKFHLDRRGFGFTPEELAQTLRAIADDLRHEERMDG